MLKIKLLGSGLILLSWLQVVSGQSATGFDNPLVNGERALRFRVETAAIRSDLLDVTVFYSDEAARLDDLTDSSLSRGKPVLELDRTSSAILFATFIFPHQDFPTDPNRSLYRRYRATGREVVRYTVMEQVETILDGLLPPGDATSPPSPLDIHPVIHDRGDCVFYRVRVRVRDDVVFTSETLSFRMPDSYNIAIAGDSYAAGEGAPQDNFELVGDNEDMWSQNDCHRSRRSGMVRGVKQFILENPDIAVDYIHVACTGAGVSNLISREQTRAVLDFSAPHPIQFDIVQDEFLGEGGENHGELNLLLLSIGGNNAGFGSYVADFIILPGNAADDDDLPDEIEENLEALSDAYADLDDEVQARFPTAKIAMATYPDSTRGPLGRCGNAPGPVEFAAAYNCCLLEVDPVTNPVAEYRFTKNEFIEPLNEVIRDRVNDSNEPNQFPDWYLVDLEELMGSHGFCDCGNPYINRLADSVSTQGDPFGVVHPNRTGYREVFRDRVHLRISEIYGDFVTERKGGIAIALLLGIDSPAIPEACVGTSSGSRGLSLSWLTRLPVPDPRLRLLGKFLKDKKVRAALQNGRRDQLEETPAFKKLVGKRVEAQRLYDEIFPNPKARQAEGRPERESEREKRARERLREYLTSKEFQEMRLKILSEPNRGAPTKDDKLDKYFNRQVVKKNRATAK